MQSFTCNAEPAKDLRAAVSQVILGAPCRHSERTCRHSERTCRHSERTCRHSERSEESFCS